MNVGTKNSITAALETGGLDNDERLVLAFLVDVGFDDDGKPVGRAGILTADALAQVIYSQVWETEAPTRGEEDRRIETCKRRVRKAVNRLIIRHGISICCLAGTGGGYFLPAGESDVESNYKGFHRRAMTGLVKASRGRKAAYADAMVQLTIGFEAEAESLLAANGLPGPSEDGPPAWVSVVTGLLQRVKGDPAKYAAEIKRIQDEFGDIFVRRDKMAAIRQRASELLTELEGLQA